MLPVSKPSFKSMMNAYCRREDGSFIVFSLFLFIVMIMFTGLALDLMRFETKRALLQSTIDRASLAAASLDQTLTPEEVVEQYFIKAGLEEYALDVKVEEAYVGDGVNQPDVGDETAGDVASAGGEGAGDGERGELVSRSVTINTELTMPTYIMHMMGTPGLTAPSAGSAKESIQNVEISLVLDVSGSMGSNNRLKNLKEATTEFIETVIDEERTEGITTMSIIPYNGYVVVPDEILDRLNAAPKGVTVANPNDYGGQLPGALQSFPDSHTASNCVRFRKEGSGEFDRNDFNEVAITQTQRIERVAHFDEGGSSGYGYDKPVPNNKSWCPGDGHANATRNEIMLPSADISDLQDKITALTASGWTGIDNGVKWAAALLDPAFRPVINDLIDKEIMPEKLEDRPNDYDKVETIKIIVVMTDGDNTLQRDLKDTYKNGPSRIWYSEDKADDGDWYDGYFVEMPNNSSSYRWYQPRSPSNSSDHRWYRTSSLPSDLKQLHYVELYQRFS